MVRIILISENMMGNKIGEEKTGNRKRKGSIKKDFALVMGISITGKLSCIIALESINLNV